MDNGEAENVVAVHDDCVVCRSQADTGPNAIQIILLMMVVDGYTAEDLQHTMCFMHRRLFEDSVRSMRAQRRRERGIAESVEPESSPLPSPEDVERALGPACSIEEARRRVELGKQVRAEMMRPKKKGP